MINFQINQDITYNSSPLVKKNKFLDMPAENTPIPKYEEISHLLPSPIWQGHDDAISCYNFAWRTAFGNIKKANADIILFGGDLVNLFLCGIHHL